MARNVILRAVPVRRRNGSTTYDEFGKVTPVESIYLLLQNSRQTYAADYHDHAAQTDASLSAH